MPLRSRNLYPFFFSFLVLAFVLSAEQQPSPLSGSPILGFSPQHAAAEHQIESMFQSIPSPDKAREWHRTFTAEPHPAASGRNNQLERDFPPLTNWARVSIGTADEMRIANDVFKKVLAAPTTTTASR